MATEPTDTPVEDPPVSDPPADPPTGDPPADPPEAYWPDDWRQNIAGEDKSRLKTLERFNSPGDMANAYDAMREKVAGGELREPFPDDGDEKAQANWRKSNGIPEAADGYLDGMPDGLVIGEDDKDPATEFAKAMHGLNASPAVVHEALAFRYKMLEEAQAKRLAEDDSDKDTTQETLIAEMGLKDYRSGVNGLVSWCDTLSDGAGEAILNARGPDGKALINNPAVARALFSVVRQLNPVHSVVPGAGADAATTIADELATLRKMMGPKDSEYWKGPLAKGHQKRYHELLEAEESIKAA